MAVRVVGKLTPQKLRRSAWTRKAIDGGESRHGDSEFEHGFKLGRTLPARLGEREVEYGH